MIRQGLWAVKVAKTNQLNSLFFQVFLVLLSGLLGGVMASTMAYGGQTTTQVYRCQQNGVVVYSQLPCGDDAQAITVKSSQGPGFTRSDAAKKIAQSQQAVTDYLNAQGIESQIAEHYRQIAALKTQLAAQLAQMKTIRYRSEKARDEAYAAVEKQYQDSIKAHHQAIKTLTKSL